MDIQDTRKKILLEILPWRAGSHRCRLPAELAGIPASGRFVGSVVRKFLLYIIRACIRRKVLDIHIYSSSGSVETAGALPIQHDLQTCI